MEQVRIIYRFFGDECWINTFYNGYLLQGDRILIIDQEQPIIAICKITGMCDGIYIVNQEDLEAPDIRWYEQDEITPLRAIEIVNEILN